MLFGLTMLMVSIALVMAVIDTNDTTGGGQHGFDTAAYTQTDSPGGSTGPMVQIDSHGRRRNERLPTQRLDAASPSFRPSSLCRPVWKLVVALQLPTVPGRQRCEASTQGPRPLDRQALGPRRCEDTARGGSVHPGASTEGSCGLVRFSNFPTMILHKQHLITELGTKLRE